MSFLAALPLVILQAIVLQIVLLPSAFPGQSAQNQPQDALALLTEVSQRYAHAKSYHIEAVEERTETNELHRSWEKSLYTAIHMSDGRYRYEGRDGFRGAVIVSDGTTQWRYHLNEQRFTQKPAAEYPAKGQIIPLEELPASQTTSIVRQLAEEAHRLKSATFLPDESVALGGRQIDCYVVRFSSDDLKTRNGDSQEEQTIWIDKSRRLIVRTFRRSDGRATTGPGAHIAMHSETTRIYSVVELDQDEPASSFLFVPPSGAEMVAEFAIPFMKGAPESDLVGKSAPDLQFKSVEGKVVGLSSFRGKPVFLEFWATWCAPCVDSLPDLTKLYAETQNKGLIWVTVDNDVDASDVAAYLAKKHLQMPWPNYHDEDGSLGKAFERNGIPLGVLIDRDGKVVFYRSGYEMSDLRSAIAKLGPEFVALSNQSGAK